MIYKMTVWAAKNKRTALLAAVFLQLIIIINGFILGKILFNSGVVINEYVKYIAFGMFMTAVFFYPVKAYKDSLFKFDLHSKLFKYTFRKHKILDLVIASSSLIFIIFISNNYFADKIQSSFIIQKAIAADIHNNTADESFTGVEFKNYSNSEFDPVKKNIEKTSLLKKRDYKKKIKNEKHNTKFFWAIFLVILLCVTATLALAVLSCVIICSGFEVLGGILFFGGGAGLVALSIWWVKKILRKREIALIEKR